MNIQILDYCKKNQNNCIVLLQTPRAGEVVDNGMGVDFDLAPHAIICRDKEKVFNDFKIEDWDKIQLFNIDNCRSLERMIFELQTTDAYEVVWRNENYKEPEKLQSELKRIGVSIEIEACLSYSLTLSYEELQRYYKERSRPSPYQSDLFRKVLEDMLEFEELVGPYFPLDRARLQQTKFSAKGLEFIFNIPKKGSVEIDESHIFNIQSQLEKDGITDVVKLIQERLKVDE